MKTAATTLAALLLAASAHAQPVYRCGSTYSQQPCPGGSVVNADDKRDASQAAAAKADMRRVAKAADAMEKDRRREEAKAAPALVMQPQKPASAASHAKDGGKHKKAGKDAKKKPDYFTAVAPKKAAAK